VLLNGHARVRNTFRHTSRESNITAQPAEVIEVRDSDSEQEVIEVRDSDSEQEDNAASDDDSNSVPQTASQRLKADIVANRADIDAKLPGLEEEYWDENPYRVS
jgi:hypothetical protein